MNSPIPSLLYSPSTSELSVLWRLQRHISGEQLRPTLGAPTERPHRELHQYLGPSRGTRRGLQLPWTTLGRAGMTPASCLRRESKEA